VKALLPIALVAAAPVPADIQIQSNLEQGGVAYGTVPPGTVSLTLGDEKVPVAPDGRFLLGFDRDAPATLKLEARTASGAVLTRPLAIARHAWAIQRVDVPKRPPVTNEEVERLRAPEVAQIVAARAQGCLLVTRRHRTRLADIEEVKGRLQPTGAQLLGAVINE